MKKVSVVLLATLLACAMSCGGEETAAAGPVAQPGTEVPTQTTTQVVPIDASAAPQASPSP
jgi:hypothetical protein